MNSIVSYPNRGPWGSSRYRGNCSGHLLVDLFQHFRPKMVLDPMVGSGTTRDVCEEMGIPGWFGDLRDGFNILREPIPQGGDFGFMHPPYHNIVQYSGNVWGKSHPEDLSRCPTYEDFLRKLNQAQFALYDALRRGGHTAMLVGDVRKNGTLYPIQRDMAWFGEPVALVIKQQHNCWSQRRDYAGKFIALVHEYLVVTRKPDAWVFPLRVTEVKKTDLRNLPISTWRAAVQAGLEHLGGEAELGRLYGLLFTHAKVRQAHHAGHNWQAQIRRALQVYPDFESGGQRGRWRLVEV